MTPKRILISAGTLLLALLVVLIVALSKSNVRAGSDARIESAPAGVVQASDALADTNADGDASRTRGRVSGRSATVARKLPPFAEANGVRLSVLSAGDRSPVPGAEVRIVEQGLDEVTILNYGENWIGPDFEAFMNANGHSFVTDENGEVDLPRPARPTFVCARLGDRFGYGALDAGEAGLHELCIRLTHSIAVRVRDSHGVPRAGVRVAFGRCEDGTAFWDAPTNARGEVRVPAIEVLLGELGIDDRTAFALRLCIPERTRVEQWLTLDTLPATPIEFVIPATGSVRVRVVDEAGSVLPVAGAIDLTPMGETTSGRAQFEEEPSTTRVECKAGIAVFPRVGLGLRFALSADLPGTGDTDLELSGPTSEGEEITIDLSPAADHTLLMGRIVDESGKPLANRSFDWRRLLDDGRSIQASGRNRLVTDGAGRFLWTLRLSSQATGVSTHRTGYLCEISESPVRRQATVHFPLEITSASTPLGDIVMAPARALAHGRVLDSSGRPAVGAEVALQVKTHDGLEIADTYDSARTDADGSFAIFGPCLALDFVLDVYGPTIKSRAHVPFVCAGTSQDLELFIDAAGGLEGTALIDHDASLDTLNVTYTPDAGGEADVAYSRTRRVGDRLYFRFDQQAPGPGKVRFFPLGIDQPAALIVAGVVVEEARVTRPSELNDVDLRGMMPRTGPERAALETVEFTIVDALGRSIPRGMIFGVTESGGDHRWSISSGKTRVPTWWLENFASIECWAPGTRVMSLAAPYSARRVVLEPELELEFVLALPQHWIDAKLQAVGRIELLPTEPPQFAPVALGRLSEFRFDKKGRAAGGLPVGGRFAVYIALRRQGVEGVPDIDYYGVGLVNPEFTVRETDGRQTVELALDPDAVTLCNEALGLR